MKRRKEEATAAEDEEKKGRRRRSRYSPPLSTGTMSEVVLNCCRSGCLFRAIAYVACLRNGEATTYENHQRELADVLRDQAVDELLTRRKETECKKLKDDNDDDDKIQQQFLNEKNESVSEMSSQGKVLDEGSEKQNQPESLWKRKTGIGAGKYNISDAPNGSTHHIKSVKKELSHSPSNLVFGYLNLFYDGGHNFTDGIALGSAFLLYGSVGGWSTTRLLLAHELPQESWAKIKDNHL
ncbi:IAA-alanine resistance protein 1 [Camellia lanceoleosa]|uniref:IAA-alanine resistance protein 1 n=1 Tax=Camellia lanceoleosa TaxID=1840588 RepID=A0ACC0FZI9_9ERIC|nr:IAA-alanine resistance protein 1 [Camellia lanceoleosa]